MTAAEAYDDCIKAARDAAARQNKSAKTAYDPMQQMAHETASIALDQFAAMLEKMKEIRRL